MKTIARRLSKLEDRFAARRDEPGRTLADVVRAMRERRRRRLAAAGCKPEEDLPWGNSIDAGNRPRSLSGRMRWRRFQQLGLQRLSLERLD